MTESEVLLAKARALSNTRRLMLILNALSYTIWMVALAFNTGTDQGLSTPVWGLLQTVGPIIWGLSLIGVLWSLFTGWRRPDLLRLIDDERTQHQTMRAFQVGYFVVLFPLAGIYTASWFTTVDVRFIIPIMLALGVATPSLTYALFYRD